MRTAKDGPTWMLDPDFTPLLERPVPLRFDESILTQARTMLPSLGTTEAVERRQVVIEGSPDVTVTTHRPVGATGPLACMLSIHGGGFIVGSSTMDDLQIRGMVPRSGADGNLCGVSTRARSAVPGTAGRLL